MLFNGEAVSGPWTATRALHYGDGVFRTALVMDGRMVDRERQLARLAADADALDLDMPEPGVLDQEIDRSIANVSGGALRIVLSRVDSGRGYAPGGRECDRLVQVRPLPAYPSSHWARGVHLGWSKVLLGIQPRLAGIKHLNRLEQVLASRDWPDDQHEALMCDADGRVICGSRSNLFFVIDNILVTPDVSLAGVAGMMRSKLIGLAREKGLGCEIGLVAPDELRHATECFVSNSLIGMWPVRRIGGMELPAPGPVTRDLMGYLDHPWSGT